MKKHTTNRIFITTVLAVALAAACGTAFADLTISNSTTTTSWNQVNGQNPFYVSLPSASLTGFTAQGQPSANSGATSTVLSETFTITNGAGSLANGNTNYVLRGIAIVGGGEPANSSIHIYDVTTNLTSSSGTPLQGSGATYNFVANGDLLGNGNGLTLSNTLAGTDQVLYNLSSGPNTQDQIVLGAGHTYAFEIKTPTTGGGFSWSRNSTPDPGGQGMGSHDGSLSVARLTITSLGLAGGAPRTFAMALYGSMTNAPATVNNSTNAVPVVNYYVDQFNSFGYGPTNQYVGSNNYNNGDITNIWRNWTGSAFSNLLWDASSDANGNPSSGAMEIVASFPGQFVVYDGANGINPPLNALTAGLTSFQCDVRFDPSSPVTVNNGTGSTNYGHLQFGMTVPGAVNGQDAFGSIEIPVGTTNWVHVNLPISVSSDANLAAINNVFVKIDGNWYSSTALSGVTTLWVDNMKFVGPAGYVAPPPPTMAIQKATPGLRMFAGSTANTYDRVELATTDQSQSWIGGHYPVSYSFKLLSYPANINQTHIFLVPVNTSGQSNMGNSSGSVNEYIEYQATNALWLDIQPAGAGQVTASIMWKTNLPNSNPNNTTNVLTNATAIGTWTLTFTSASSGTVTAPGGAQGGFTIADANVATDFANPLVAYFGLQPNSSSGIGQYEDWGSISVNGVAGVNENEDFTQETALTGAWNINTLTTTLQSCVQVVSTNTPFWVTWTLPAPNYGLATVGVLQNTNTYPWQLPEHYNSFNDGATIPGTANQGNLVWVLVPISCLPTVDGQPGSALSPTAFFRLFTPPLPVQ
jgi:hypothetical protein